jgi:hypothetical protein
MSNRQAGEFLERRGRGLTEKTIGLYVSSLRAALGVAPNEGNEREGKRREIVEMALARSLFTIRSSFTDARARAG